MRRPKYEARNSCREERGIQGINLCFLSHSAEGTPSDEELEELSRMIGDKWKPLGRRLVFTDAELTAFHKENEEYDGKAYQMLLAWKQRDHPGRSGYRILYKALSHKLVCRKDLAEEFCCVSDH